ncbi:MAG: hypothetical protein IJ124_14610 [Clostridia bacterium]|nr:hypothetical protein [Clostridia bacterium]
MTVVIIIVISSVLLAIGLVAVLAYEAKDKQYRRENNLPARRYHDITDYDVREVYTVNYTNNRRQ